MASYDASAVSVATSTASRKQATTADDAWLSWWKKNSDSTWIHLPDVFTQCAPVRSALKAPSVTRVWQWLGTSYTNDRCRCHSCHINRSLHFTFHMRNLSAFERNYYIPSRHGKMARVPRRIFLSISALLFPPEIKKNTAGPRSYLLAWYFEIRSRKNRLLPMGITCQKKKLHTKPQDGKKFLSC